MVEFEIDKQLFIYSYRCDNKPAVEITESKFEQSDKGNNDKDNDQDNDQDLGWTYYFQLI